jgi:hypothetical protein
MDGIFKARSKDTKGINIDDKWYNASKIWQFTEGLVIGDTVNYSTKDNDLTFIQKKEPGQPSQVSRPAFSRPKLPEKDTEAFMPEKTEVPVKQEKGTDLSVLEKLECIKTAIKFAKLSSPGIEWPPDDVLLIARKFENWVRGV